MEKKIYVQFFHNKKATNQSVHKQVRKVYSLPKVDNASGGFRVKRYNPIYKEEVYQLSAIEGFSTKGLDKSLKNPVLISEIEESKNLSPTQEYKKFKDIIYFDEWRVIKLPEKLQDKILSLRYCIGTKDRFYTSILMPTQTFRPFLCFSF